MKYPFEKQIDLKDCGVCCLSMITRYYGGGVSREYLRQITNTTKDGVSAYSLIEGAKTLGFSSYGVSGTFTDITNDNLPCIAHVIINKNLKHFIVIYKIDKKKKNLLIADPAKKGLTKISFDEFKQITSNKFILLKPQKKIKYIEKNLLLKKLLINYLYHNTNHIFFLFLLSFIITLFNILSSFQFKFLIELVIEYNNINNLPFLSLLFLFIIFIKEVCSLIRNKIINNINHRLDKLLFSNVYNHILSLPYLYYKNRTTGEVVSRMEDLSSIRNVISKLLVTVILDSVLALFTLLTLFFISNKLTIILVIILSLILTITFIFRPLLEDRIIKSKEEAAKLNSFLIETINGIETIKNQNILEFIKNNFLLKYCKYNKNSYDYNNIFIIEQFIRDIIDELGTLIIMIFGCILVLNNKLNIASLITYITLMNYLLDPIKNIIDLDLSYKDAKTSFIRIKELYEIEEEKDTNKYSNKTITGNIISNNLMYSYNGKDLFLKDINLNIKSGDRVLIYGSSGSGKSTLAKILSKELDVKNKKLFYDDKDINNYNLSTIRKDICYISQQETLFTDSIYQNIVLDKIVDYDDFLNITQLCMVNEFTEKNILAYDMLLEENGFNLSGGQRQRVILARSMLKNANIYIFDESLNEVDINKERKILENLFKVYKDKTFIIISHRFHNQDLFNKKYRIENGVSYEE